MSWGGEYNRAEISQHTTEFVSPCPHPLRIDHFGLKLGMAANRPLPEMVANLKFFCMHLN